MLRTHHGHVRTPGDWYCSTCGYLLQQCYGYKRRRPYYACDGCGSGHIDVSLRIELYSRWESLGRPLIGA